VKSQDDADKIKLFVKNLPLNVTEEMLKGHFPAAVKIRLPTGTDKKIKGFAFLEFKSEEIADKVKERKQGSVLGDKTLAIDYVGNKSENAKPSHKVYDDPTKTLFVKELSYSTTMDDLKKAFGPCEEVRLATFPDTGKSRGYAFICYETEAEAKTAQEKMNKSELDGRTIKVTFALKPALSNKKKQKHKARSAKAKEAKNSEKSADGEELKSQKENSKPKVNKAKKSEVEKVISSAKKEKLTKKNKKESKASSTPDQIVSHEEPVKKRMKV